MPSYRLLLGLGALLLGQSSVAAGQTVKVTNGTIQGVKCQGSNANSFLGIPYAKAPVKDLRFAAPQPYDSKYGNGILQATKPAPNCPQFGSAFVEKGTSSEDCLFLDVYVPSTATPSSKLPVKVWIYGGSNEAGGISDPTYNGCFAASNTILVTINYRVGPLGWLALPDFGISGNFGTQDQLLALAWVQENIASFGGDPARVLLFGQSAGAANTFLLATLPQASKLFSAVALESGAGRSLATIQQVTPWNKQFAQQLNCSDAACLRAVSVQQLNNSELALTAASNTVPGAETLLQNNGKGTTWSPVVDGTIVPSAPLTAGLRVPAIAGSNTQEGTVFVLGTYLAGAFSLNVTHYDAFLAANFGPLASTINDTYPLSKFTTPKSNKTTTPTLSTPPAYNAIAYIITSYAYHCPARRALRSGARNGLTNKLFTYSFAHTPSCAWYEAIPDNGALIAALGATHTAEIPFVFNLTRHLPPGQPTGGNCSFSAGEVGIAAFMSAAWDAMAGGQKPGKSEVWPAWSEQEGMGVVVGGEEVQVGKVDYGECDFWDGINEKVADLAGQGNGMATGGGGSGTGTGAPMPSDTATTGPGGKGNAGGRVEVGLWVMGVALLGAGVGLVA